MDATLTGSGWAVVDGSIDPKRGFEIADTDDSAEPKYFGYESATGRWVIMKQSSSGSNGVYRYAAGSSGYAAAWANRASLGYDYASVAMKRLP